MSDDIEMVKRLHATTDASVWVTEFLKVLEWRSMHDENVLAGKEPLIEEGWMIGWFANAIEIGRDAGKRSVQMATNNPVMHALVDLCEALGKHPSPEIHASYERAMAVIRDHTGMQPEAGSAFAAFSKPEDRALSAARGEASFHAERTLYFERIVGECHNALGESEHSDHDSLPEAIATHIRERNERIAQLEKLIAASFKVTKANYRAFGLIKVACIHCLSEHYLLEPRPEANAALPAEGEK